jgi:energy-coupling factor transport system ATP-binding protein
VRKEGFGPHNLGYPTPRSIGRFEALNGLDWRPQTLILDLPLFERKLLALGGPGDADAHHHFRQPTTGQDARGMERIGRIIEDLRAEGRTVITISHDVDFCAEHFPRVVLMSRAQILLDGPAETVLSDSQHLAQAAVEPPQVMRLADKLDMAADPLTVDEFVDALIAERGCVTLMAASKGHVVVPGSHR